LRIEAAQPWHIERHVSIVSRVNQMGDSEPAASLASWIRLVMNDALARPVDRSPDYLRLLTFVVSNARAGELMAIDNYSDMVRLLPDADSKLETVHQALEESKHVVVLDNLARTIGFGIDLGLVEPQWRDVRERFVASVHAGDLAGCLIIQDLMVETLAIALYRTFASASNFDAETSRVASKLLADELEHLDMGARRIRDLLAKDPASVHASLAHAHHTVMPLLFEMVHDSCQFLCRKAHLDCTVVVKPNEIDLDMLKLAAVEHYVEMLGSVGFDPLVTGPLIASMAAYEPAERTMIGPIAANG
jgi:fatty aldehyde decarbonylase